MAKYRQFQQREGKVQGDLTTVLQYLQGSCRADGGTLFTRMPSGKTRGKFHPDRRNTLHQENKITKEQVA